MPAGFSPSSFGPVMKPSRDIAMVKNTFDIALLPSSGSRTRGSSLLALTL
jgi:hypothetical protein